MLNREKYQNVEQTKVKKSSPFTKQFLSKKKPECRPKNKVTLQL